MRTIVFDFDGTLSYKDSLKELFCEEMMGRKRVFRVYYYMLKVLSKLKLTTVKFEKEQMLKLLFHSDVEAFAATCRRQAKMFRLNPVFARVQEYIDCGDRVIVLSASSMYFLETVFAGMNVELVGTKLSEKNGKIQGIERHPFYKEKVECLKKMGIHEVDEMYYDSKWDECLIPMCREWHKVQDGIIVISGKK